MSIPATKAKTKTNFLFSFFQKQKQGQQWMAFYFAGWSTNWVHDSIIINRRSEIREQKKLPLPVCCRDEREIAQGMMSAVYILKRPVFFPLHHVVKVASFSSSSWSTTCWPLLLFSFYILTLTPMICGFKKIHRLGKNFLQL